MVLKVHCLGYYIYFLTQQDCTNITLEQYDTIIKQQLSADERHHINLFKF